MKYEYRKVRCYSAGSIVDPGRHNPDGWNDMTFVDAMLAEGWELVAFFPPLWAYFKREITEKDA